MAEERQQRRKRLTTEQKWQVFLEASRKNTSDAEVCRRWGITPFQLRHPRARESGGGRCIGPRAGRPRKDPEKVELEVDLERTNKALRELAIENTLLRGKVNGV